MNIRVFACLALLTLGVVGCGDNPTTPRPPPPKVYPPPPTIVYFEISDGRTVREPGERLQLNWVITQVKWVNLDDGIKIIYTYTTPNEDTNAIAFSINPGPIVTTTYALKAANSWGTAKATLTVTVK